MGGASSPDMAKEQLIKQEKFSRAALDSLESNIAVLGRDGRILQVNRAWLEFGKAKGLTGPENHQPGGDYLRSLDGARGEFRANAEQAAAGIRGVMAGAGAEFRMEYSCGSPEGPLWFLMLVTPLKDGSGGVVLEHLNITARKLAEDEHTRLLHILEESLNEIYIFDGTTLRFEFVNRAAQKNLGYTMPQLAAMTPLHLKTDFTLATFRELLAPLVSGEKSLQIFEAVYRRADGSLYPVEAHLQRVNHRSCPVFLCMVNDITQRKETERALNFQQEFNRILLETLADGVVACDANGRLTLFNRTAREWHGMDALVLPRDQWSKYYNLCEVDGVTPLATDRIPLVRALDGESVRDAEMSIVALGQAVRFISCQASPLLDATGGNIGAVAIMRDITQHMKAEVELRGLALQLMHAEDVERRRIAKELHDSSAQDLVAAMMNLSVVQASLQPSDAALTKRLDDTLAGLEKCTHDLRTLAYVLHPPRLEEAGLGEAIRAYAAGFAERSGITLSVEIAADFGRLPEEQELALFRVVQESLGNIRRHSGSTTARIHLARHADDVALEISDSGCGLPAAILCAWPGPTPGLGVGFAGMRERLGQIGGRLEIQPGSPGTTVRAILPLRTMTP